LQRLECHEIVFSWNDEADSISNLLDIADRACIELCQSKEHIRTLLAIVLSIGNHINGDTARGQAYGTRLDVLEKFSNLKSGLPGKGSLMNYLGVQVEKHAYPTMKMINQWVALWAAADISLSQIKGDITVIEIQLEKVRTEFALLLDSKIINEIERTQNKMLAKRLEPFLNFAVPKFSKIKTQYVFVEGEIEKNMTIYGESLKDLNDKDKDPSKLFFQTITSFVRTLQETIDDNKKRRTAEEKEAKIAEGFVILDARRIGNTISSPTTNIFSNFHSSQAATSDELVEGFNQKLQQKFSRSNNG
jgi:hypothetical protein